MCVWGSHGPVRQRCVHRSWLFGPPLQKTCVMKLFALETQMFACADGK